MNYTPPPPPKLSKTMEISTFLSPFSAISPPSSGFSPLKSTISNNNFSFNSQASLRFTPLFTSHPSSHLSVSSSAYRVGGRLLNPCVQRLFSVQATVLKENEEKVFMEESFQPKSSPDGDANKNNREQSDSSFSNASERWIIKLEQSINILLTDSVIKILDTLYRDRDYARFFVLETIARVPYFAFMSVLHMYESFGWWRRADYLKVHFAESWNEMHHLLIMEELGGNAWWFDRFLSQHIAVFYYFMTALMYLLSPRMAYHFSECVENHAFETYDKFIKAHGEELKKMQAAKVAIKYYTEGDMYLFDEFQTSRAPNSRRPKIENLYDVFVNIRDDEAEHCKTMKACQTPGNLRSPHDNAFEDDAECILPDTSCEGIVDCIKKSVSLPQSSDK